MEIPFEAYARKVLADLSPGSIQAVLKLHAEGGTVPFIARYRKEKTGNLDEVQIQSVIDANQEWQELVQRSEFILKEVESQGNLTSELRKAIEDCLHVGDLEELYRPYKKKKKSKATIARDAGLEPLSEWILKFGTGENQDSTTLEVKAKTFMNPKAGFVTYEEVLKGAQDIIVEKLAHNLELREAVKYAFFEYGVLISKAGKGFKPNSKFENYADYKEPIKNLLQTKASHRYLAVRRGWNDGEVAVTLESQRDDLLLKQFEDALLKKRGHMAESYLKQCAQNALQVYMIPSITNEVHRVLKDKADKDAIFVFVENVRRVLMASPFGPRCVLGIDPGLRTGCKVALIDKMGKFISHTVIRIHGEKAEEETKKLFAEVFSKIQIDAVAVGNGTGGREAETFLRKVVGELGHKTPVIMVNESGASVYSASEVAREEFPDLDVTVRGAISIARRLQDPLAELVKIDPKSIGVGQYQHDVPQNSLKKGLTEAVESCVNFVGVDVNTASQSLLSYVSGIGPALAKNIVEYRQTNGLFQDRSDLQKVTRMSTKIFEQSAGFLRILGGKVLLDQTGIHPERYSAVRDMAQELNVSVSDLVGSGAKKLLEQRTKWCQLIGEFTFDDIVKELEKPGRDPRDPFKIFTYRDDIHELKDLKEGMICPGLVTNVTNFGAFVDIGVHQDGLVHISQLSNQFIDDPRKVVKPGDQVQVRVLAVDAEKKQISLSMVMENQRREVVQQSERPKRQESRPPRRPDARADGGKQQQRPQNKMQGRPDAKPDRGQKPQGQQQSGKPRPNSKPFNNPFAALMSKTEK